MMLAAEDGLDKVVQKVFRKLGGKLAREGDESGGGGGGGGSKAKPEKPVQENAFLEKFDLDMLLSMIRVRG